MEAGKTFVLLKGVLRRTAKSLSALSVKTTPSAPGNIGREVADDLLSAMDLYEATAMETLQEGSMRGTDIDGLIEAGE